MEIHTVHGERLIEPRAMNDRDAAVYIGMSLDYLRAARRDGPRPDRTPPPPHIKIGRSVRYLRDDLDAWLDGCRVEAPEVAA